MTKFALKTSLKVPCAVGAAILLATASLTAPQVATAGARAETCKPVKTVQKAKTPKATVHKTKAKVKTTKAKTVALAHKSKHRAKVIKVTAAPCDCRKEVKIVKVIQPVIEREVTVYRAEPSEWHAPYVDEVSSGRYVTHDETAYSESYSEEQTYHSEHQYERRTYSSDRTDYLAADTRPGRHRHKRWTSWME